MFMARVRDYGRPKRRAGSIACESLPAIEPSYRIKFVRDQFARCDTFQELYADGVFHDEY